MESDNNEFHIVNHAIKAERRYRFVLYLMAFVVFGFFMLVSFKMLSLENRLDYRIDELFNTAKQLSENGYNRDEEARRYITCLLVHPIETRDVALQRECFRRSDLPGGLDVKDFEPIAPPVSDAAVLTFLSAASSLDHGITYSSDISSSKPTPKKKPEVADNSHAKQPCVVQ